MYKLLKGEFMKFLMSGAFLFFIFITTNAQANSCVRERSYCIDHTTSYEDEAMCFRNICGHLSRAQACIDSSTWKQEAACFRKISLNARNGRGGTTRPNPRPGRGNHYTACENAMTFSSNISDCLNATSDVNIIMTCANEYTFDSDKAQCMRKATNHRVAQACFDVMTFDSNKMSCLESGYNASTVRRCGRIHTFDSDKLSCIRGY